MVTNLKPMDGTRIPSHETMRTNENEVNQPINWMMYVNKYHTNFDSDNYNKLITESG